MAAYKNFIGGDWVESISGRRYPVFNPARKTESVGEFQTSTAEDATVAVEAARAALPGWANTPAPGRASVLFRALEIMGRRADEIARTITTEEGKPIGDANGEVKRAMNIIEYAAGEGRRMFGYTTPSELPNTVAYTIKRPLGVVGIITPWNFPIAIPAWKIAPALIWRQRSGIQARVVHAAVRSHAGRGIRGGGAAPRSVEPGHRAGRAGGERTGRKHRRQRHLLHRVHRDRHRVIRQKPLSD